MYSEAKATQMAARLVTLAGTRLNYVKLLKLMYLADRAMLTRHGKPITYDRWVSMQHGPVLSATYDCIKGRSEGEWAGHLRTTDYDVQITGDPGCDDLSPAELNVIDDTYRRYGAVGTWKLRDMTHELKEWQDPGGSSRPISYREILEDDGLSSDEVETILANIAAQDCLARLLGAASR